MISFVIYRIGNVAQILPETLSGGATDDYYWTYWVSLFSKLFQNFKIEFLEIKSHIHD